MGPFYIGKTCYFLVFCVVEEVCLVVGWGIAILEFTIFICYLGYSSYDLLSGSDFLLRFFGLFGGLVGDNGC